MERLIINAKEGIFISENLAAIAARAARTFEADKGERKRITVTIWKNNDRILLMAHSKNIWDSGGIWSNA